MTFLAIARHVLLPRHRAVLQCRWAAAAAAAEVEPRARLTPEEQEEARAEQEELEEKRERQRWQDRYEFTDEEIEEELRQESKWKEKWRSFRQTLRYHLNAFEDIDNLTQRRERFKFLPWNDVRLIKAYWCALFVAYWLYAMGAQEMLAEKFQDSTSRGGGADWPTHYIALKEIHEGRRSLSNIVALWEKVREAHQRDWLLPLLTAQALESFCSDPPALRGDRPSEYMIEKLAEQVEFVEGDARRMSAEVAVHLHNLLSGDVKWPGRPPNNAVMFEMEKARDRMCEFTVHPLIQQKVDERRQAPTTFYSGSGYFQTTTGELMSDSPSFVPAFK